jgi:transposase
MVHLFWLSDGAWAAIEPHLPRGKPGKPRVDDRRVISGILHVLRTGCRWRDCPQAYGPPTTIYNRYNRWSARGLWQRLFEKIAASGPIPEELCLDSSHVKAHRSAAGGNVWPAPSASDFGDLTWAVCINVSGLRVAPWPRWRSARPGPHKGAGIECHFAP